MKFINKIILVLIISAQVQAGSLVDDLFNLVSLGQYHQEYLLAKDRVNRDIAAEKAKLQSKLKDIEHETENGLVALYTSQLELANLKLSESLKIETIHKKILVNIEQVLLVKRSSNKFFDYIFGKSKTINDAYNLLTSVNEIKINRDYLKQIQKIWWNSILVLEEEAKYEQLSFKNYLTDALEELDEESLEALVYNSNKFSALISALIESQISDQYKYATLLKTQLEIVSALSK